MIPAATIAIGICALKKKCDCDLYCEYSKWAVALGQMDMDLTILGI